MRLTKKLMFSIEAVIDIAFYSETTPVQSQKIAARRQIPPRYLEQVLQYFARAKIIKSNRGPRGGYQLARARTEISVGEIVRLVRQMESSHETYMDQEGSELGQAVLHPIWQALEEQAMQKLESISIDDLCQQAKKRDVLGPKQTHFDFI